MARTSEPGTRRRPPGSTDVARLAGVSQKTVSRVMNDEPHVTDEVRQRVLQAAQQLGYRRNNAARALTSGRSNCIGVVSLGSALYGPATELVALERAARRTGYAVSIVNTTSGDPGGIAGAIDTLLEQGVDAIVLSEPIDEGPVEVALQVPVLALGPAPGVTAPHVITSLGGIGTPPAYEATEHLLSLGHRTVHHVAGPQPWFSARERVDGWRQALRAGGAVEPAVLAGDWSVASGYAAGRALAADPAVTAVFAGNDDMAIGVIRAMVEAGRAVPDDVSVVGFDDIPIAAYLNPPLTTVLQPFDEIVQAGIAALVQVLERPDDPAPDVTPPQCRLVVRSSTAPPR
ncbi:LacI family DNA-binding transcriptional regulator [Pseudonocardia sp. CA-107938]|uniref:LacI family DNA-binding transcriptional regulator n=1 Tax=Pseudonocardia sp. CA-107938 TaxID=3240021 RepID=UPI003D8C9179